MKFTVIIAEYNPLHNGHIYHLKKARELGNPIIVLMSGAFVQRGEPAISDKYRRAEIAIHHGADAVFEIPAPFAFAPADKYAYGAFRMLDNIDGEITLSFGSESGDIDAIYRTAKILIDEPIEFKTMLKRSLDEGFSLAKARQLALENYANVHNVDIVDITAPNNILALEYTKLNILSGYKYTLVTHKRIGSYKEDEEIGEFMSASAIRNRCHDWESISPFVPADTLEILKKRIPKDGFGSFLFKILETDEDELKNIFDVNEGFENRIIKQSKNAQDYSQLVDSLICGHFSRSRVQRILTCILLNVTKDGFEQCMNEPPLFNILAINAQSKYILGKLKNPASISQIELRSRRDNSQQAKYTALTQDVYRIFNGDTLQRLRVVKTDDDEE